MSINVPTRELFVLQELRQKDTKVGKYATSNTRMFIVDGHREKFIDKNLIFSSEIQNLKKSNQ